jgi:hypothetical protein
MKLNEQPEQLAYAPEELGRRTPWSARWWRDRIREGAVPTIRYGGRVAVPHFAFIEFFKKHLDTTGAPLRPAPEHIQRKVEAAAKAAGEIPRRLAEGVDTLEHHSQRAKSGEKETRIPYPYPPSLRRAEPSPWVSSKVNICSK